MSRRKPPASGWRSMASAPRDGKRFLGIVGPLCQVRLGSVSASGEYFRADGGCLYVIGELLAWAPIPEWTGEVSE